MTDLAYHIRPAVEADLPALTRLDYEQLQFHANLAPDWIQPVGESAHAEWWRPQAQKMLSDPNALLLVAESEGELLGYLAGRFDAPPPIVVTGPRLYVDDLHVLAEQRGRGIGTALLGAAYRWAMERGAGSVTLEVLATNSAARALYDRLGFEVVELKMRKSL